MVGEPLGSGRMERAVSTRRSQRARDRRAESDAGAEAALTGQIIQLAIKVHRQLGPGLLESVYEACLCWELEQAKLVHERQVPLAVRYEDVRLACGYRADIIVAQHVILEIKSIEHILPLHEAQVLIYLRLSGCKFGLLLNFNTVLLKDGIRRFIP
ncbi:MAG TPA: GxxExxY protein [Acetobacteraceae bacterium]|nr:GxxExxY protein [Acetobacteraceae bacterium]